MLQHQTEVMLTDGWYWLDYWRYLTKVRLQSFALDSHPHPHTHMGYNIDTAALMQAMIGVMQTFTAQYCVSGFTTPPLFQPEQLQ